ncbi:MAG: SDR family oxidoreductase [Sphingobium sp.]|nr:SDR family oxidoreductase [Sphingobium sp.]
MATIVIAGASRGIGLALVRHYAQAQAGNRIFAWCRNPAGADALNALAAQSGGAIDVGTLDMADGESIDRAAASLGGMPVDLLLNVGGLLHRESGPEDRAFDGWRESFEVMVIGPFRLTQALLPNLTGAQGKVLSVTSQIGASTWTSGGLYSYGAAKAALNRVMKSLAVDLKDRGIAVGVVHPGHVQTDMGGASAAITPDQSAEGIAKVASALTLDRTGGFFNWTGEPHPW